MFRGKKENSILGKFAYKIPWFFNPLIHTQTPQVFFIRLWYSVCPGGKQGVAHPGTVDIACLGED